MAHFDNDAAACYDCIIVVLASLCGRKQGINRDVIFIHATTLREAKFKLKTKAGLSDTSYSHCTAFPIHGTGQGSTNSPTIWCFISSELFDVHSSKAHGMVFTTPDGSLLVRLTMIGFVDDSTCITGGNETTTYNRLIEMMQEDAQLWHDLLWTLGGKLELSKCGYHAIDYEFDDYGVATMKYRPADSIRLRDHAATEVEIHLKTIFTTRKNLGHYKALTGTCKKQFEMLKQKALQLTSEIAACGGSREDVRLLVEAVRNPAVMYPIAQSFLSEKQMDEIDRVLMPRL